MTVTMAAAAAASTALSEAFQGTSYIQSDRIIPIDFNSLKHLPDSHVWFPSDKHHSGVLPEQDGMRKPCVPVIDLTAPNAAELVRSACERWGMFQVTNHGVARRVIEAAEEEARRLFALPVEQKQKAARREGRATGYGVARISPFFAKQMWHEGFTIIGPSAAEHARRIWPCRYQEFCDAMDNYQKEMKSLADKLLVLMLKALGAYNDRQDHDQEQEQDVYSSSSLSSYLSEGALQLNSYPSCPNPSRALGLAPHTDTALLTILHQSDVNGLQVFQEDRGWVPVPPVQGALAINVGDLMHILSNGHFPSVLHRVFPHEARHRVSMAYFCMPSAGSVVAPLPGLPCPRFEPMTVREYVDLKYKHFDKALDFVRNT